MRRRRGKPRRLSGRTKPAGDGRNRDGVPYAAEPGAGAGARGPSRVMPLRLPGHRVRRGMDGGQDDRDGAFGQPALLRHRVHRSE